MARIFSWAAGIWVAVASVMLPVTASTAIAQEETVIQLLGPSRNYGPAAPANVDEFGPPPAYRTTREIPASEFVSPSPVATPPQASPAQPPAPPETPVPREDAGDVHAVGDAIAAPDTGSRPPAEWDSDTRRVVEPHPAAISQGGPGSPREEADGVTLRGNARVLIDGQSLMVNGQAVRLDKIHAPHPDALCYRGYLYSWECGQRSRAALAALLSDLPVTCRGRIWSGDALVARCVRRDGVDIASALVRQGMAIVNRQYFTDYVEEENHARSNALGMWAGTFTPPWEE